MAQVRIEQRNAHLAGNVRLEFVNAPAGRLAKATFTAISNHRTGSADERRDTPTAIQWTLWDKQAEACAQFLTKGSHVNVVGRLENNTYTKAGETVYGFNFTAEEVDWLDTKDEAEARRAGNLPE